MFDELILILVLYTITGSAIPAHLLIVYKVVHTCIL